MHKTQNCFFQNIHTYACHALSRSAQLGSATENHTPRAMRTRAQRGIYICTRLNVRATTPSCTTHRSKDLLYSRTANNYLGSAPQNEKRNFGFAYQDNAKITHLGISATYPLDTYIYGNAPVRIWSNLRFG